MAASCPRCGTENHWPNCSNCGGNTFQYGPLANGAQGLVCTTCNLGQSHVPCVGNCGAMIPALEFMPGWKQGLLASQQGGGCVVALAAVISSTAVLGCVLSWFVS
jgi:hypothetical protein